MPSVTTRSLFFVGLLTILVLSGCGSSAPEVGDKKEDWAKSAPPAGWKGPGQASANAPGGHIEGPPQGQ